MSNTTPNTSKQPVFPRCPTHISTADTLIGWTAKIKCLGEILTQLADSQDTDFDAFGGDLGGIIKDYADAIDGVISDNYATLKETLD